MKTPNRFQSLNVAIELFWVQVVWTLWYLGIMLAINLAIPVILSYTGEGARSFEQSFFVLVYRSGRVFMLVAGIVAFRYMIGYFVGSGVTRRQYFYGSAAASAVLSLAIIVSAMIVAAALGLFPFFPGFNPTPIDLLGDVVVQSLVLFSFAVAGWIIAVGFYQPGFWSASGSILLTLVMTGIINDIWEQEGASVSILFLPPLRLPPLSGIAAFGTHVAILAAALLLVRYWTRNIRIRVE